MIINLVFVDDELFQHRGIKKSLEGKLFTDPGVPDKEVEFKVQTYQGLGEIKECKDLDILLLDINLGKYGTNEESKEILNFVKKRFPSSVVILYSGTPDDDVIIDFMLMGADNFIAKSIPKDQLSIPIMKTYLTALQRRSIYGEHMFEIDGKEFIGDTIREVADRLKSIIPYRSIRSVLVYGETGTGKEVVADLIEKITNNSHGKRVPFFRFNCGAVTDTILESELFGSVKGAYTGAVNKSGYFEKADGGWIFLDEVATLSPSAQNSLMRVIENNELTRVGSNEVKKIDVRVISATNEDLDHLASNGKFRKDLIQRLKGTVIHLPALRDRSTEEIEELIRYLARKNIDKAIEVAPTVLKILKRYDWKEGNIRELKNTINSMVPLAASDNTIYVDAIPRFILNSIREKSISEDLTTMGERFSFNIPIDESKCTREYIERKAFVTIYNLFKGRKSLRQIAEIYGVSHSTVLEKAKKYRKEGLIHD